MNWKFVHSVWALVWHPRKTSLGVQTLCMALLLFALTISPARADCPAAPIADADDMVVSFLALNGTQAAPGSLMPSIVKEGMLVYDDTENKLKICDGTNWVGVGTGGSDTLASLSCSSGQIAKYNGAAWACAADGGGAAGSVQTATQTTSPIVLADGVLTDTATLTVATSGTYSITAHGYNVALMPWLYFSSNCYLYVNGVQVQSSPFYYGSHDASTGSSAFFPHSLHHVASLTAGQTVKTSCLSTSNSATRQAFAWRIDLVPVGGGGADTLAGLSCSSGQIPKWNGTTWACAADGGGGASTGALKSGFPDTIGCTGTAGTAFFDLAWSNGTSANYTLRGDFGDYSNHTNTPLLSFTNATAAGVLTETGVWPNWATNCSGKTIAQLTAAGQTFNMGGSSAASEISASAYRNTAQSIASSAWQILNMEVEEWDTANMIDIGVTPSRITIPSGQAGRYLVTSYTSAGQNANNGRWLSIYKNGALQRYCSFPGSATLGGVQTFTCSWTLNLAAGDYLELAAYQSSGAALDYIPRFSVTKMAGGGGSDTLSGLSCSSGQIPKWNGTAWACAADGGGSSSATPSFHVHRDGTAQTVTAGSITQFDATTATFDAESDFDLSTNRFTPSVAGKYILTGAATAASAASGTFVGVYIRKNGIAIGHNIFTDTNTSINPASRAVTVIAEANGTTDYFDMYIYRGVGTSFQGSGADTYFAGSLVSGGSGADTLSGLSCSANQIPKWNGTAWACAADGGGSGSGTEVLFLARKSAAVQTGILTSGGTPTVVTLENEAYDTNANFASSRFTPTIAGHYLITGSIDCSTATNNVCFVSIMKNGSSYAANQGPQATGYQGASVSAVVPMNGSTDYIELGAISGSGTIRNTSVFMSGALLGGGADTLSGLSCSANQVPKWNGTAWACAADSSSSTPTPHLRLFYNAGTLNRSNIIPFTALESTGGATWASNKFTVVTPGVYLMTVNGFAFGQYHLAFTIRKNTVDISTGYGDAAQPAKYGGASASAISYLNAGEQIDFFYNHDTPNIYLNAAYASIAYLGGSSGAVAGSDKQVQFNDNGTQAGAAQLYWDKSNNRLGIGTATPGSSLHVVGGTSLGTSINANSPLVIEGTTANGNVNLQLISANDRQTSILLADPDSASSPGYSGGILYNHATDILSFRTAAVANDRLIVDSAGSVSIGSAAPAAASSILDLTSTTKGFLLPRMNTTQRDAISSPAAGLMIFNTTVNQYQFWTGSTWSGLGGGVPTGTISAFAATTCPTGWTEYVAARGRFLRGIDNGAGNDPSGTRAPGNVQADELKSHTHNLRRGTGSTNNSYPNWIGDSYDASTPSAVEATGGAETRPKNVAVLFCQYAGGAPLTATPSGPAGAIQYADGTGGLSSDPNIVVSAGKVGIGTSTPSAILHTKAGGELLRLESTVARGSGNAFLQFNDPTGIKGFYGYTGSDDSLRMWNSLNAALVFAANGGEKMRINPDGKVGIGTTTPVAALHIKGEEAGIFLEETGGGANNEAYLVHYNNTFAIQNRTSAGGSPIVPYQFDIRAPLSTILTTSTGNVGLGTTPDVKLTVQDSQAAGFVARFRNAANVPGASGIIIEASSASSAGGAALIQFLRSGGAAIGSVTHNGLGTVSYNTTSDARLKEHIVPTGTGLSTLMKIQVRDYNYLGQPDRKEQGFIAQELYEAYPQVVKVGGADAKNDPWSIDYGKLTPLLVKAVQDLKADNDNLRVQLKAANDSQAMEIEELRREINALKAAR